MHRRGFTLFEVIVTLALLLMCVGLAALYDTSALSRSTAARERDTLIFAALLPLRANALANVYNTHHGLHISDESFVLFYSDSYDPASTTNRVLPRDSSVHIDPQRDIIFERLSGNMLMGEGPIMISSETASHTVTIDHFGRIDW